MLFRIRPARLNAPRHEPLFCVKQYEPVNGSDLFHARAKQELSLAIIAEIRSRFLPRKPAAFAVASHWGHEVGRAACAGVAVVRMAAVSRVTIKRLIALTW